jgi:hypothetical protein
VAEPASSLGLSAALEGALLRALGRTWEEINQNHFAGRMRRPVLALDDAGGRLGRWDGERRTLGLSRALVLEQSWATVREVLKHEIAHQFVEEVLGVRDQSAHGPAFASICERFGIDRSASGLPVVSDNPRTEPGEPVLRRIARLLALAGSPNLHEAEAAMRQAHRLMLKYNIDAVTSAAIRGYGFRHLGAPLPRIDAARQILAGILGDHFFVEVIWVPSYDPRTGREGRVLEACGSPANLEVAAWVHDYLLETGLRLWREHQQQERIRGDRDRRRFLLGVMMGFRTRLEEQTATSQQEGLIWQGDPELADYLRRRYPRRSSGGRIGYEKNAAYQKGHQAGQNIVLRRAVPTGGENRGRLLGQVPSRKRA